MTRRDSLASVRSCIVLDSKSLMAPSIGNFYYGGKESFPSPIPYAGNMASQRPNPKDSLSSNLRHLMAARDRNHVDLAKRPTKLTTAKNISRYLVNFSLTLTLGVVIFSYTNNAPPTEPRK